MKAIIVVDMQNDFSEVGSIPINGAIKLAKKINEFLNSLDKNEYKIIATKDWHHFKHCSFNDFPSHCVYFTEGSKLIDPLDNFNFDLYIKKGSFKNIENLSPFYNGKKQTKLKKFLIKNNIIDVYIVGVALDYCIKETIKDLIKYNFNPILIENFSLAISENYKLKINGLKIKKSWEI